MSTSHIDIVRGKLKSYCNRGVFRGYSESSGRLGKTVFKFTWLLDRGFVLECDPQKHTLTLKNLLPHVPNRSHMDQDLRGFVQDRDSNDLPAHRRVDAKRANLSYANRKGTVSLTLTVKKNQYSYGVTKLLNTTNELFGHLHMVHISYLWKYFEVPEE
ncbi:MAG: hypothetical protein O3C43_16500 [Verrucomicrobia bacterium]|nr:hypothetical protein [Verrucomicrobiota bacterium]MDA1068091.1 hypothetical protein [Verrucomicrobiota bacterium]